MRKYKVLKNVKISLVFFLISMVISFVSRGFFIKILGANISGLNNLIINLLGFLNIIELGVGSAITFSLYRPLKDRDNDRLNEIMVLFRYYYEKIGIITLIFGIILSFFLNFFVKNQIPIKEALIYYYLFLINNSMAYYFTYKQTLIIADQKQYIITAISNTVKIIKTIIQIIALIYTENYFIWIVLEVIFNIGSLLIINLKANNIYKTISFKSEKSIEQIKSENKYILKAIKDVFFHKIATFIVYQTDGIMISLFLTLKQTAIYGNYMMIINNIMMLFNTVMGSFKASIGDLIAEDNDDKSLNIFKQLHILDNLIAITISFSLYKTINMFIILWVGKEYLFENTILLVLIINLYIQIARSSLDKFKESYGLFWDRLAPIVEGAINLIISIILVRKIGVIGLFIGTFVSNIAIIIIWKPYILFEYGFKRKVQYYYKFMGKVMVLVFSSLVISNYILKIILSKIQIEVNLFVSFIINGLLAFSIIGLITSIMFLSMSEFRQLLKRIVER